MHMVDALLSPPVSGAMLAVSAGVLAYSVRDVRRDFQERRVPLMGVAGAFIFAAQMINFAIPGTGSSGHIGGAVLLAALLGSSPAFIVMAGVLLIQALFFADGGLLAWGCNLFNLGFFGCYLAYPYLFRPVLGRKTTRPRIMAASCVACVAALELGAFSVTLETLLSGVTSLPFGAFVSAMLPIHLAIGLVEGLATGAVLIFISRRAPEIESLRLDAGNGAAMRFAAVWGLTALLLGGGVSLLASGAPDGLEWSLARASGGAEPAVSGAPHGIAARIVEIMSLAPDYVLARCDGPVGTSLAGLVGALICAALIGGAGYALCCRNPRRSAEK